ncbi:ATP-binding protein [Clostridium sp.]|uniref:ATP-binding protein n=1 Tax=Clostridium sp. TaxID=1506 RepID=UPI00261BF215|nr:ATP-binding protein [Clostridium sp.]
MVENDKRIRIITGHYGSGKTEFALNYVAALSKVSKKSAIADLDIVNVYFRSREKKKELEEMGIKVISSSLTNNSSDMPAISREVSIPVRDNSYDYVIDLGGNDVGAITLSRLKPLFNKEEIDFFMVVNTNRPDTSTVEKIIEQMRQIEFSTGLKVTGFINNTNLIRETDCETIKKGEKILLKVSDITGVTIKYTTYITEILPDLKIEFAGELFPMKFFMRKIWM